MKKEHLFLAGLGGSIVASVLWKLWPSSSAFKLGLYKMTSLEDPEKSPLAFMEHYHYGLASLTAGRVYARHAPILDGFGVGLIITEALGDHPFGIGKSEYEVKGNITVASILSGILLASMVIK